MMERKMIIDAFRDELFPLNNPNDFLHYVSEKYISPRSENPIHSKNLSPRSESPSHSEDISPRSESPSRGEDKLDKVIIGNDKTINKELFREYFQFQSLSDMQKSLSKTQNAQENKKLVQVIKSGLMIDLVKRIKKMSEDEIEIEKPYKIVDAVAEMFEFNRQNQKGKGLKTLTPQQMLSRLPFSLAQLKAGNNSEKRKNEIR